MSFVCVCVGQRAREGEQEKGKKREENLGQIRSEPHLKRVEEICITSRIPVWEERNLQSANEVEAQKKLGGLMEVCQLHNDTLPAS